MKKENVLNDLTETQKEKVLDLITDLTICKNSKSKICNNCGDCETINDEIGFDIDITLDNININQLI